VGFVKDKIVPGRIFSGYFGFPYQFSFHLLFHTYPSSGVGIMGPLAAELPSGLGLIPHLAINNLEMLRIIGFFDFVHRPEF
jgi:hypothetical protein